MHATSLQLSVVSISRIGITYLATRPPAITYRKSGWLELQISLEGQFAPRNLRNALDQPFKVKKWLGVGTTSLSRLFSARGLPYTGPNTTWEISAETNEEETTTARQELESRAVIVGGFVNYSRNFVEIRTFGAIKTHYLSEADVISAEIIVTPSGDGTIYQGVALSRELHNAQLRLEKHKTEQAQKDERITLFEGNPNPQNPPNFDKSLLRSPSLTFDNGGPTEYRKDIEFMNGQPVKETEQVWGLIYKSWTDTHEVSLNGDNVSIRFSDQTFENYWTILTTLAMAPIQPPFDCGYSIALMSWEVLFPSAHYSICKF